MEGCKTGETPSLNFNQLYTSGGVDFSGILGLEGPQDVREFILQETLQATSEQ
jgi:hypothetical protein